MAVDLAGLSPKELDALIQKAKQRKQTLQKRSPIAEVRKALAMLANKHGWTLAEVFGGTAPGTAKEGKKPRKAAAAGKTRTSANKGTKVAAKYRHPESGQTWTGRGIPPKWLAAELAQGRTREEFRI